MPVSVAIVGSGPAGFYTAQALIKKDRDFEIDIIERLPTPFGLIRGGVAPDHQTTKRVVRAFEATALKDPVRYFGNVEIGLDVGLSELRSIYDAVVLAVGSPIDRIADLPGRDKIGVIGSAAFVGWYNGHPDFCNLDPNLDVDTAAVIGVGNVAIDIARVLVKTESEMEESDLPDYAAEKIRLSPLKDVYMFGRRGPLDAKFTNVELREMGKLENCVPQINSAQLPDAVTNSADDRDKRLKEKNLVTLKEFAPRQPYEKSKRVHFEFYATPTEILGDERVEGLRLERTLVENGHAVGTGEFFEVSCGLIVPAIGYRSIAIDGVPFDEKQAIVVNNSGRVEDGLYAVGWVMRGPTGVIATNRPDGVAVADHISEDYEEGSKPGRSALKTLLSEKGIRAVSFNEWQKIDQLEVAAAPGITPRRKFVTVRDMLSALQS